MRDQAAAPASYGRSFPHARCKYRLLCDAAQIATERGMTLLAIHSNARGIMLLLQHSVIDHLLVLFASTITKC
jgi:hypothetical protein